VKPKDTIVKQVRAIREEHAAKHDYDLRAIVADIKRQEQNSQAEFVTRLPRKPIPWSISSKNHRKLSKNSP